MDSGGIFKDSLKMQTCECRSVEYIIESGEDENISANDGRGLWNDQHPRISQSRRWRRDACMQRNVSMNAKYNYIPAQPLLKAWETSYGTFDAPFSIWDRQHL